MPHLRECWRFTINFNEFMMNRLEQLTAFLQDSPSDAFLHYAVAQELYKLGMLDAALDKYLWLTEHQPQYVATYYHLGKLLVERGEKEAALAWFNLGIEQAKAAKELHSPANSKVPNWPWSTTRISRDFAILPTSAKSPSTTKQGSSTKQHRQTIPCILGRHWLIVFR